jgi:predicted DNA-binding transcriptional regulator AlpA
MTTQVVTPALSDLPPQYEFINPKTLAQRWCLPETWIYEQVRSRSTDPLPHVRFGKYVRFRWGSPELEEWAQRRKSGPSSSKTQRTKRIQ